MKPKRDPGVLIVKNRTPDKPAGDESHQEGEELRALEDAVEDFMRAVHMKDVKRMAQIIKMAHDILHEYMDKPESEPQEP